MTDLQCHYSTDKPAQRDPVKPYHPSNVRHFETFQQDARATVDRELKVRTSVPQPPYLYLKPVLSDQLVMHSFLLCQSETRSIVHSNTDWSSLPSPYSGNAKVVVSY